MPTTSYLIDINVWLALSWRLHPYSQSAHAWLQALPKQLTRLPFCRITQLGLLRLLTNEAVMGPSVLTIAEALAIYDRWLADPRVEFRTDPAGMDREFRKATAAAAKKAATKVIMDAYLAGFAGAGGATLVTFDKALAALAKRSGVACLLLSAGRT